MDYKTAAFYYNASFGHDDRAQLTLLMSNHDKLNIAAGYVRLFCFTL